MGIEGGTFSESWHRVADQRLSLRPTVRIRKQMFRGAPWYVLNDPFNNNFYRLRPEAHEFANRLRPELTVAQAWEECLARNPDGAPGQDEVIQILNHLYHANLLLCARPADSARLFERRTRRRQREIRSKLLGLMFLRIPLFDPDSLLRRCAPMFRWLTGPLALALWLVMALAAGMALVAQSDALLSETRGLLVFDNLILLYAGLLLIKAWHEIGHAVVCSRFGGEVHVIGVMLMIFTPLPYMDATSSWSFRHRGPRILVSAAGIMFELFAAFCAALLWANTGPGTLHSLAFNMMFVASVSTLLFNANPLLRYDGYYILSDLIDIPNLSPRSASQLKHLGERYLFGCEYSSSPALTRGEAIWLTAYGLLSGLYRIIVYGGIILFVADRFLLAGLVMAAVCVVSWGIMPALRFAAYLSSNPRLARTRTRAVAISLAAGGLPLLFLAAVPLQNQFRAPGVLEAQTFLRVANDTPGRLAEVLVPSGTAVDADTPLLELVNPELDIEITATKAQRDELLALQKQAIVLEENAERDMLRKRLMTLKKKLQRLHEQRQALVVRAQKTGTWVSPDCRELTGTWIRRGSELGVILSPDAFSFSAVVSQEEAANLFSGTIAGEAEIRLVGLGDHSLRVERFEFIPFQHQQLPSAAIGWLAGGEVPVSGLDESGLQTIEPFFLIYAYLAKGASSTLYHGHSGQIRFPLRPEPLWTQWSRKFRQLLQRRYQT